MNGRLECNAIKGQVAAQHVVEITRGGRVEMFGKAALAKLAVELAVEVLDILVDLLNGICVLCRVASILSLKADKR